MNRPISALHNRLTIDEPILWLTKLTLYFYSGTNRHKASVAHHKLPRCDRHTEVPREKAECFVEYAANGATVNEAWHALGCVTKLDNTSHLTFCCTIPIVRIHTRQSVA